jgi:hypothetical protein
MPPPTEYEPGAKSRAFGFWRTDFIEAGALKGPLGAFFVAVLLRFRAKIEICQIDRCIGILLGLK